MVADIRRKNATKSPAAAWDVKAECRERFKFAVAGHQGAQQKFQETCRMQGQLASSRAVLLAKARQGTVHQAERGQSIEAVLACQGAQHSAKTIIAAL